MALMLAVLAVLAAWLLFASLVLAVIYRQAARRFWREPVLKRPVLIFESDDWGAGPVEQIERLEQITACLCVHRDSAGNSPVMTLGVVLAIADGVKIETENFSKYHALDLSAPQFHALVQTMQAGVARGVFSLQLHGMEHYWPETLLAVSRDSESVRTWLKRSPESWTEDLPSHIQSRWCDSAVLPSRPLPALAIQTAVRAEVRRFTEIFGGAPRVVVPPTFVWNAQVEQTWAEAGVKYLVTPGRRYESRSVAGRPVAGSGGSMSNGDVAPSGIIYLVRDVYFEPAQGHRPEKVVEQIECAVRLGRPTLLETHRSNFVRDELVAADSLIALSKAIELALRDYPQILFLSTVALADKIEVNDRSLIEQDIGARLVVCWARLSTISRLRKFALLSGVGLLVWGVFRLLNLIHLEKAK